MVVEERGTEREEQRGWSTAGQCVGECQPPHTVHVTSLTQQTDDPLCPKRRRSVGPLTPHQGKTVEGTCLGGYVVERSLDLGEVSTC